MRVQVAEVRARPDALDALGLHLLDEAVDGAGVRGEGRREGDGAGDVAGVAVEFGAGVEDDEFCLGKRRGWGLVGLFVWGGVVWCGVMGGGEGDGDRGVTYGGP